MYGPFARNHGTIGANGRFAVFANHQSGYAASAALLRTSSYLKLTLHQAIARRSLRHENDTERLQQEVSRITGLAGTRTVESLTNIEFHAFLRALHRFEGTAEGQVAFRKPQ